VISKTAAFLLAGLAGVAALLLGQAWDFYLHAADPTLAHREGIFAVTNPGHVLLGIGLPLVVVGVLGAAYTHFPLGPWGRRGFLATFAALILVSGAVAGWAASVELSSRQQLITIASRQAAGLSHHQATAALPKTARTVVPVTAAQLEAAARLLHDTLAAVAKYRDQRVAVAAGYQPMEAPDQEIVHFVNRAYFTDADVLEPQHIQSLIYYNGPKGPILIGAMYIMPRLGMPGPEIGGSPYDVFVDLKRGYTVHTENTNALTDPTGAGALPFTPDLVFVGPRPAAPEPRLPDLVPDRPKNFHLETAIGATFYQSFDRGVRHPPSCYPQETSGADNDTDPTQQAGALRCLRFDQGLMNLGRGPFEIRAYPNNGDGTEAYQAVYRSDGTYTEKRVGMAKFSNAHGHVHFMGFDHTGLFTINPDGSPGREIAHMVDKGRCAVDTHDPSFGNASNGPAHYYVPSTCDQNDNQDPRDPVYPNADYFRSGISAGWEDTYPWFIPDQYIDITNVPDGRYLVVNRVNVSGLVAESETTNDASEACVEFHGTTVNECPTARSVTPPAAAAARPARRAKRHRAHRRHRARHGRHHRRHHHRR